MKNEILIRHRTDFAVVDDGGTGRLRTFYVEFGDADETAAVERAEKLLETLVGPQQAITAAIVPVSGAMPYDGVEVGDGVLVPSRAGDLELHRVVQVKVAVDELGNAVPTPVLSSPLQEQAARVQRWLASATRGTVGGTVQGRAAGPVDPGVLSGELAVRNVETFAQTSTSELSGVTGGVEVDTATRLSTVVVTVKDNPGGVEITPRIDGVALPEAPIVLLAGTGPRSVTLIEDSFLLPEQRYDIVYDLGEGADGVVIQTFGTEAL